MQTYTTQMDAARKGIITPQMEIVAKKEYRTTEEIRQWVAEGKVAIPANKHHECLNPEGVGSMLRTKINVNLGVSRDCKDYNVEMQKVMSAVNMGAEAIMDLSSHGNTQPFRQKLTHECPVMIGTVPVYDSVIHYQRDLAELTAQDFIDVVRLHAEDGVDFVTLHCGITRKTIEQIRKHKRKMNIVSRGGSLVFAWMCMTGNENPFYEHFDEILDICEVKPAILQTEVHPYSQEQELKEFLAKENMVIQAWYPLGHGDKALIQEPVFSRLAEKYGKSNAQIILRWHIQAGNVVIPGSKNPDHIRANFDLFDFKLDDTEMAEITALNKNKRYYTSTPDMLKAYAEMVPPVDEQK